MKKTLVLGASTNTKRYSNMAIERLYRHGYEISAVGHKEGTAHEVVIEKGKPYIKNVDTITIYLNANHQKEMYDYVIGLQPKRIIFNPGSENQELANLAVAAGIEVVEACTLVLLSTNQY